MRYTVQDLPANAAAAFTPIPAVDPIGGLWGSVDVWGAPGTDPVEAVPGVYDLPGKSVQKGVNSGRGSDVAPNVWFPSVFVALATNQGPEADAGIGMWRRRFNELPVPAVAASRIAQSVSFITKKGGRLTQAWPRAFQRFPTGP